jgi:tryptophan synthase alpha subunit
MKYAFVIIFLIFVCNGVYAQNEIKMENNTSKLAVLWTSGDPDVAEKMAFMYTYNAKKQDLGIDVKGMGVPLSNYLKDGWKVLSL